MSPAGSQKPRPRLPLTNALPQVIGRWGLTDICVPQKHYNPQQNHHPRDAGALRRLEVQCIVWCGHVCVCLLTLSSLAFNRIELSKRHQSNNKNTRLRVHAILVFLGKLCFITNGALAGFKVSDRFGCSVAGPSPSVFGLRTHISWSVV